MYLKKTLSGRTALALATSALAGLAITSPASAQVVADRTLSDINVDTVGGCTTLTINFNIRLQVLSHFPDSSGRELHVRIRPLDADGTSLLRESLRTPSTVPELRSIEYEGDNPSGPVLSLFFTRDMRFEIEAGARPQSLVVRLAEPGAGPMCSTTAQGLPGEQPGMISRPAATAPAIPIPPGLYALNLISQTDVAPVLSDAQRTALANRIIYEMSFERDSQHWHRLRMGFFETREEAEAAKTELQALFPEIWVVKVSAEEREQGVANRIDTGAGAPAAPAQAMTATPEETAEAARLVTESEQEIRDGNLDRAIQLLTKATELPESENSARARELLGLTRERKGQSAHAQAEYEEYLRRYPQGEGSDRVRQRLAALKAPGTATTTLRAPTGSASTADKWTWRARGSLSQFYYRDQSSTKFVDASRPDLNAEPDDRVNLNQLLTSGDVTISGGDDRRQVLLRAAGSYTFNFNSGRKDIQSLTALYLDYDDSDLDLTARVGRQTRNSSGVLGRFDGLLLGWQTSHNVRINLVGGFPVLSSRQTHVLKERYFYGASVDIGTRQSPLQTTVYWFDQRAKGGFIDRQSVGIEARYLASRFNAFTLLDYDVKYGKLNLGLATLNYNFPDNSNLSITADYRQSPLLTTSNALIGQIGSLTMQPITELQGLRPFFTDAEIYQLAEDRTLVAKSATISYSRPISKKLQTSLDFTITDTGGTNATPASSGTDAVAALPATGTEYFYGLQFIGTGLLMENDIYILSGRYSDTQRKRTYTADINARIPVTSKFRVSPRLRFGLREDKFIDSNFRQVQPSMRFNYYPIRHSEIEVEVGANFTRDKTMVGGSLNTTTESGYLLTAGYRLDF